MAMIAEEITRHLQPLVGLRLSLASRAGDMRCFDFGQIYEAGRGIVGQYALHVQCPWRIEGPQGIVTGRDDLWEPAEDSADIDWDTWNYEDNANLQDKLIQQWLGGYDPQTRKAVNETDSLTVEAVQGDAHGGATLILSGGFRLILFPAGTRGEDWRVFRPHDHESHFVIAGGIVET